LQSGQKLRGKEQNKDLDGRVQERTKIRKKLFKFKAICTKDVQRRREQGQNIRVVPDRKQVAWLAIRSWNPIDFCYSF
jgi:hypothetical protein